MPTDLYRVVGIRTDGSRFVLVEGVSHATAVKTAEQVSLGVFADVVVERDSASESSPGAAPLSGTSQGKRSVDLFPERVQPPRMG